MWLDSRGPHEQQLGGGGELCCGPQPRRSHRNCTQPAGSPTGSTLKLSLKTIAEMQYQRAPPKGCAGMRCE